MSYSGDAAEQVVRMSLEGTEVAVKLAGSGAKQLAILLIMTVWFLRNLNNQFILK